MFKYTEYAVYINGLIIHFSEETKQQILPPSVIQFSEKHNQQLDIRYISVMNRHEKTKHTDWRH